MSAVISQTGMPRRPRLRAISRLPCAPPRMMAPFRGDFAAGLGGSAHLWGRRIGGDAAKAAPPLCRSRGGFSREPASRGGGDRSGGKRSAGDEAQQRAKASDRVRADKMQLGCARFKSVPEHGGTLDANDLFQKLGRQNSKPRDVDPISGAQQDVIERCRAVIEIEHDATGERPRSSDGPSADCR